MSAAGSHRLTVVPGLDAASYARHATHAETCAWPEKNCYVDLWIELVHALGLESTESRMVRIARNQSYFGREIPVDEVIRDIEAVTSADIIELAREIFAFERLGVALLGDAAPGMVSLPVG